MDSLDFKKLIYGLKLGLISGAALGLVRAAFFLVNENYQFEEIKFTAVNLFCSSVNQLTLFALLFCFAFAVLWLFFRNLESLALSTIFTALIFLPAAYLLNKKYLPGIFEVKSLIGNALLILLALITTWTMFRRWLKDWHFVKRVCHKFVLLAALALIGGVNLAYRLQPAAVRLDTQSADPRQILTLFDSQMLGESVSFEEHGAGVNSSVEQILRKYLETKVIQRFEAVVRKIGGYDSQTVIAHADSILKRRFTFVNISRTLPKKIDWRTNPTKDKVWLFNLNRQEWLWDLPAAFHLTRDQKYVRAFEEIMSGWFEQNPMPDWKNESDAAWRLMETSLRMTSSWLDAFTIFYFYHQLSDELTWRMLASFHAHAQFLMHFRSPGRNHLLQETFGLMAVAGVFPEFKMAPKWLKIANLRLDTVLNNEIYPDGGYNEVSTFYHRFVVRILQQMADFAKENRVQLSDYFYEKLEQMYEFLLYVARPDGMMPQMNDGFTSKDLRILFEHPAEYFDRADFEYFASNGVHGQEPEQRSAAFPYSGIYVMRSDWKDMARWMIVDAGLFGSAHGHEDKLSFELFAFGKPFIVESGTYTYIYNHWHKYFESSFAHNTIVVDNKSQMRQPNPDRWVATPPTKLPNAWYSNPVFDYLESSYRQGYGNNKEAILQGVEHTRRILFVKPDYWLLWDVITGEGQHKLDQLFHFAPDVQLQIANVQNVQVRHESGPVLLMKTLRPAGVLAKQFYGADAPLQGWISPKYGVKEKAPVLDFRITENLPVAFVTVLYPIQKDDAVQQVKVEWLPTLVKDKHLQDAEAIALKVTSADGTDYILMAPGVTGIKRFGEHKTPSQLYVNRTSADGSQKQEQIELMGK
ncbi:MAG: alginate lyase family protein [bacterium]